MTMAKCVRSLIVVCATTLLCLHVACAAPDNTTTTSTPPPKTTTTPTTPATTTTTTPKPSPVPSYPDNLGTWNVTEGNVTCILLKSAIQLAINYTDNSNKTRIGTINIPQTATAKGNCEQSYIILTWQTLPNPNNNTLTIVFQANDSNKNATPSAGGILFGKFGIVKLAAVLQKDLLPNITLADKEWTIDEDKFSALQTSLNHSFACSAQVTIGTTDQPLSARLQKTQIEAFRKVPGEGGVFSTAEHCSSDEVSSGSVIGTVIVTILIIVLLALGAAALVTYYLKKRRAAGSGYENM